jgi:hypothetical protein
MEVTKLYNPILSRKGISTTPQGSNTTREGQNQSFTSLKETQTKATEKFPRTNDKRGGHRQMTP